MTGDRANRPAPAMKRDDLYLVLGNSDEQIWESGVSARSVPGLGGRPLTVIGEGGQVAPFPSLGVHLDLAAPAGLAAHGLARRRAGEKQGSPCCTSSPWIKPSTSTRPSRAQLPASRTRLFRSSAAASHCDQSDQADNEEDDQDCHCQGIFSYRFLRPCFQ